MLADCCYSAQNCSPITERQIVFDSLFVYGPEEAGYDPGAIRQAILNEVYGNTVKELYLHAQVRKGDVLTDEERRYYEKNGYLLKEYNFSLNIERIRK